MEKRPYRHAAPAASLPTASATLNRAADWRCGLPTLVCAGVVLRELRMSDAHSLFTAMSAGDVSRFISPPPSTIEGFDRFIAWTHRQREAGQYVCFAVTVEKSDTAVGLFQVRSLEPDFGTAEWGFAIASEFWGGGVFLEGARLVVDFTFDILGAHRLEARAAIRNGRGNGALRKLGAVQEGVLRRSFLRHGEYLDQALWTILQEEWRSAKVVWAARIIH
jgi:ribosomal-protein-alanine N-acetyltransferase